MEILSRETTLPSVCRAVHLLSSDNHPSPGLSLMRAVYESTADPPTNRSPGIYALVVLALPSYSHQHPVGPSSGLRVCARTPHIETRRLRDPHRSYSPSASLQFPICISGTSFAAPRMNGTERGADEMEKGRRATKRGRRKDLSVG